MIRQQVHTARRWLIGRRPGRREWLAERSPHHRDLLLLSGADFLGEAVKQFVVSITQLGFCYVDGTIIATKSRSTSLDGLIFIAAIILVMAVLLLAKNGASTGPVDRQAAVLRRARANTAIPRPSSMCRKKYIMPL
jgi:hypothetical protein